MRNFVIKFIMLVVLILISISAFASEAVGVPAEPKILVVVLGVLFAISELLASLKFFNGNSIFQVITNIIKALYEAMKP